MNELCLVYISMIVFYLFIFVTWMKEDEAIDEQQVPPGYIYIYPFSYLKS